VATALVVIMPSLEWGAAANISQVLGRCLSSRARDREPQATFEVVPLG
jgi:hypothetical protein